MNNKRWIMTVCAISMSAAMMTGCTSKAALDPTAVAATVGEESISLGLANLTACIQQAQAETYYMPYLGDQMWSQDMGGITYEASVKEGVMESLREYKIVNMHASDYSISLSEEEQQKISEAADAFLAANTEKTLTQMTATKETMEELLTLTTVREKVYQEVVKEADTEVSDEEAAQKKVEYVFVSTANYVNDAGESVSYTEEEKAEKREQAQAMLDQAKASGDFEAAAKELELSVASGTYGQDVTGNLADVVRTAADELKEGEFTEVLDGTNGFYVARLVSEFDQDATNARKEEIVMSRQEALYQEVYAEWKEAVEFTLDEAVWGQVTFEVPLSIITAN